MPGHDELEALFHWSLFEPDSEEVESTSFRQLHVQPQLRDLAAHFARVFVLTSRPLHLEGAVLPREGSRECRAPMRP
jgi:hypothetical protein